MLRRWISTLGSFFIIGCFLLPLPLKAETILYSVFLDSSTLAQGYALEYADVTIDIPPGIFTEALEAKIKRPSEKDIPPFPAHKTLVSEVYIYDISMQSPQILKKPVGVTLGVQSNTSAMKRLYFFDRNVSQWVSMPSKFNSTTHSIHSSLPFPYSLIAVFEDAQTSGAPALEKDALWSQYDSAAFSVLDRRTKRVLYEKQSYVVRPMASLTKLMTALVALEQGFDFKQVATYDASCDRIGSRLNVKSGETLYVRDLWYTMLAGSANNAAVCFVRALGFDEKTFVRTMNAKANQLGLIHTHFVDATGLSEENVTTAAEFAVIVSEASRYFKVLQATTVPAYRFTTLNRGIPHTIRNTNRFLFNLEYRITAAKTGYTDEALYTQVIAAKNEQGDEIIVVLLGNPSWQDRYDETKQLVRETFQNYRW